MDLSKLSDVITPQELADFLKISVLSVYRAIKDGSLEAFRAGKLWRLEKKAVANWINESTARKE